MKTPIPACLSLAAIGLMLGCLPADVRAADGPAGDWKVTLTTPNGDVVDSKMKLTLEGEKLTGTFVGRDGREAAIEEGQFKEGQISFTTRRERNGQKFYSKHEGRLNGNTIKGKIESNFGGEVRKLDWEATRDDGKLNVTGIWRYSFNTPGGQTFEPRLKLKQEGESVTGVLLFNENEAPISQGKLQGDELVFKVVRERDGQTFTSTYRGKVSEEVFKGKIESNWGGVERTSEFEAKRIRERRR